MTISQLTRDALRSIRHEHTALWRSSAMVAAMGEPVRVQQVIDPEQPLTQGNQTEAEIVDRVSTFRFADMVVNLSSAVALVCGPDVGRAGKRFADHLRDAVEHLACDNPLQDEEIAS